MTEQTEEPCDGCNPESGLVCILGKHKGFHEDGQGNEWLSD